MSACFAIPPPPSLLSTHLVTQTNPPRHALAYTRAAALAVTLAPLPLTDWEETIYGVDKFGHVLIGALAFGMITVKAVLFYTTVILRLF